MHKLKPLDSKKNRLQIWADSYFQDRLEPISCKEATNHAIKVLDTNYKKADLPTAVKTVPTPFTR